MRIKSRAMTLVELMVAITIVSVLISLIVPGLAAARRTAIEHASANNLREIARGMFLYTASAYGRFPAYVSGKTYSYDGNAHGSYPYWQAFETWPLITAEVLPYEQYKGIVISPGSVRALLPDFGNYIPSSYHYSLSFIAQPDLWSGAGSARDSLVLSVLDSQVAFTSGKALAWDQEWASRWSELPSMSDDRTVSIPIAFADGHVRSRNPSEASDAIPNPHPDAMLIDMRLHNTSRGVAGIDF